MQNNLVRLMRVLGWNAEHYERLLLTAHDNAVHTPDEHDEHSHWPYRHTEGGEGHA